MSKRFDFRRYSTSNKKRQNTLEIKIESIKSEKEINIDESKIFLKDEELPSSEWCR